MRRLTFGIMVLGIGNFIATPARAAVAEPLRLADVIAEAIECNPALQAARARARAAAAVPAQASAFDDPTVTWESWNAPDAFRVDRAENNYFRVAQKIPFPGKRGLAGTIATREADTVAREADGVALDLVAMVTRAFADLWQVHEALAIYRREQSLLERFAHTAERKYGVGEVSQTDVLRAQVELTRLVHRVSTGVFAIASAGAELNALLSREPAAPLGAPEEIAPPLLDDAPAALTARALERRPELAAQRAAVAREEAATRLADRNYWPDFEFSVGRFVNFDAEDGFGAMASVTIPFAYRRKYDASAAEAAARREAARADLRRVQDIVRREVEQAYLRVKSARLQHDLFVTTHIPQAEQTLRVSESAYQTGAVDFLTLLDTLRTVEMVHTEHVDAATDLLKATADLERAVGDGEGDAAGPVAGTHQGK